MLLLIVSFYKFFFIAFLNVIAVWCGEGGSSMSEVQVVPDSWEDSVFDSSGENRHVQGGRPSGTSTLLSSFFVTQSS